METSVEVTEELDPQSVPTCKIHIHSVKETSGIVVRFSEEMYKKCLKVLAVRKKFNMKYSNIQLSKRKGEDGYHTQCYRQFTAVKKVQLDKVSEAECLDLLCTPEIIDNSLLETPQLVGEPSTASSLVKVTRKRSKPILRNKETSMLLRVCIFCEKIFIYFKRKKVRLTACETKKFENKVKESTALVKDAKLLNKIADIDFIAKEVMYHRICYVRYDNKMRQLLTIGSKKTSQWKAERELHKNCFSVICNLVDVKIIQNDEVCYLNDLYNTFLQLFFEAEAQNYEIKKDKFKSYHLMKSLKDFYGSNLNFTKFRRKIIVHNTKINKLNAIKLCVTQENDIANNDIQNVAFKLRRDILTINKKVLPNNLELPHILEGECEIPESVKKFFSSLLAGPKPKRLNNPTVKIESLAHDTIYAVTNGNIKPAKQLELGLVMKTLTGSRKVINILNKLGHCVSYSLVEELETELTYSSINNKDDILPKGLKKMPHLCTALAFDNFDRYIETTSGKDTLHDTVGIVYQNLNITDNSMEISRDSSIELPSSSQNSSHEVTQTIKKLRRVFDGNDEAIQPYHKKPKFDRTLNISLQDLCKNVENGHFIKKYDDFWVFLLTLVKTDIPMWTGWNSERIIDELPMQNIWYLPPINSSPTSYSVVLHTLKLAQNVAKQCKQTYISVTYDLSIAKMALQIQSEESPLYDNIFIHLGAFHVQMSYFKTVGKFLEESGGPYVLMESQILASGSLKGFISGTHFNRCKRIHGLLAAAVQGLHIKAFLDQSDIDVVNIRTNLEKFKDTTIASFDEISPDITILLDKYGQYYQETYQGIHGKTAQYWIIYVTLIKLYQNFSRSIRTGDFDLYVHCLPKIASLMFAMNHQNYSRWLLRFFEKLNKVDETHPGLKKNLMNGGFGIRRTKRDFPRSPIDLTLEQTINADAASRFGGVTSFTNSLSARKRWAVSHAVRTALVTHLLNKLDLSLSENVSTETRPHIIKKNSAAISDITNTIKSMVNPFDDSINKNKLFNLGSGKAASELTEKFLLNIIEIGENARNKFVLECQEDSNRFEARICKIDIHTFASESKKISANKNGKLQEIKYERDLMGRILILAMEHTIDLELILQYPLTSIPLSLSHADGTMNKTNKALFFKHLEQRTTHVSPTSVDCTIVDGFYFLHLVSTNLPLTFGKIARDILLKITRLKGCRIDLVFDKITNPSIKDVEREKRANLFERDIEYCINGPEQKRPSNFLKALRGDQFKSSLVSFLINEWAKEQYTIFIENKILHVTFDNQCYKFYNNNGQMHREYINSLSSLHEEADSKMVYHLSQLPENSNVVIKSSDTDVLIITLGNFGLLPNNTSVWIETGLQSNNTLRFVHVNALFQSLGPQLCSSLPAFHAITGCDYTAAFLRKGKLGPFKILEGNRSLQQVFSSFGDSESLSDQQISAVESFICAIYGKRNRRDINKARYSTFLDAYTPKKSKGPFHSIKKFDGSSLPPCADVVLLKTKRVNQICAIWRYSTKNAPNFYDPTNHGWLLENNHYIINWFSGPQYPENLHDIIANQESETDENDSCDYDSSDDDQ